MILERGSFVVVVLTVTKSWHVCGVMSTFNSPSLQTAWNSKGVGVYINEWTFKDRQSRLNARKKTFDQKLAKSTVKEGLRLIRKV